MPDQDQLAKVFEIPDPMTLLRIAGIAGGAILLILTVQRLLPLFANRLEGRKRLNLLAVTPLIRLAIIVGAILAIIPLVVEPSFHNMVALLGTVGVALGFALKDYVSSLIAGVVVIGEKPFRSGDWVRIGGVYGEVRSLGMRAAQIVTPDDDVVAVPHAQLWTEPVANANGGAPRHQCVADFYLDPDHDGAPVRDHLIDVARTSPYIHLDEPVAVVVRETPWATHYRLKAYPIASRQQFRFTSDLTLRGKAILRKRGFRLASNPAWSATDAGSSSTEG